MKRSEQRALADALESAEALCDLSPAATCGVPVEHRRAVQIYVQSWIVPYIRMALESGVTGKSATLREIYRNGHRGCAHSRAAKILDDLRKGLGNDALHGGPSMTPTDLFAYQTMNTTYEITTSPAEREHAAKGMLLHRLQSGMSHFEILRRAAVLPTNTRSKS
jgi:hypothetical protein